MGCASLAEGGGVQGPRRVVLHLGAHKTASTHFSEVVWQNAALCRQAGVAAPRKGPLREAVTHALSSIRDGKPVPPEMIAAAAALGQGADGLLVMDENILGTPRNLFSEGAMYPRAARRAGRAARLFPGAQVEIMMALRDPATFVAASWSESLRSNTFRPFRDYLEGVRAADIGWYPIVAGIREAAPEARITIWRFEDYRKLLPRLLAIALGLDEDAPPAFEPVASEVRVGLSQRALDVVTARVRLTGASLPEAEVERVMARFPKGPEHAPPRPWSSAESRDLSARYDADLERLAELPGLRVLRP